MNQYMTIPTDSEILELLTELDRAPADALERIGVARRFRNDTERLEKLFELYTKMTAAARRPSPQPSPRKRGEGAL